ncbi:MAG: DUF4867 family protein [Lachnospiraceae bacterium]|nr:DUF4867 family protein [Lachnospiraceae bacterium]
MQIKSVTDSAFRKYGRVLDLEVPDLLKRLAETPLPQDVIYVASSPELEACAEYETIRDSVFGGMPIQIGYCNGNNHKLNAVEYHRDSEINIPLEGAVFLLGSEQDVEDDFTYDTAKMEAFEAPAGTVVEFYGTTLHYAPCNAVEKGFQVVVVLPKGTNTEPPVLSGKFPEDKLMTARNKWLIAHEEAGIEGAFVGLKGENLTV